MNTSTNTRSVLDPRGLRQRGTLILAARPDRNALAAGTILFYDNTKMDVGHFGEIFRRIKQALRTLFF